MSRPIPEFLCYKYKGVRRVDQILASATRFAWQCRKYQNWKQVQNAPDDKRLLLRVADALLDGGKLPMSDFGRLSGIFYNIQRWRKDKEELADEPDHHPAWTELDSLLRVVGENPKVALHVLEKEIQGLKTIPFSVLWELFYSWALHQMLRSQKAPEMPEPTFSGSANKGSLDAQILAFVQYLYSSVGLNRPSSADPADTRSLIAKVCTDLGLPAPRFDYEFSNDDFTSGQTHKTIVTHYANLGPLEIIKATDVDGHVDLSINAEHEFIKAASSNEATKALIEDFLAAYVEAAQRLPAQKETLDTFTSYLGINLKRKIQRKLK